MFNYHWGTVQTWRNRRILFTDIS